MQRFGQISLTNHEIEKILVHLNYPVHPAPQIPMIHGDCLTHLVKAKRLKINLITCHTLNNMQYIRINLTTKSITSHAQIPQTI